MTTSTSRSPRVVRKRLIKAVSSLSVLAAVGVALTGCSLQAANAERASRFYTPDEMPAIWANDTATFPYELASGDKFPGETPSFLVAEGVANEEGLSAITVAFYWKCSWENAYLVAANESDKDGQAKAAEQLQSFGLIPAVKTWFGDLEIWQSVVAKPALSGDTDAVLSDFAGSCELYVDEKGK